MGLVEVDANVTPPAIDEPSWQYFFKPDVPSSLELPPVPKSGILGQRFVETLDRFPVCTFSGDVVANNFWEAPPSLLSTLLEQDVHRQHGIAFIVETKEARVSAFNHIQREHSQVGPWSTIWNEGSSTYEWPHFDIFLVICSSLTFYHRIPRAKGAGKDVGYKIYTGIPHGPSLATLSFVL